MAQGRVLLCIGLDGMSDGLYLFISTHSPPELGGMDMRGGGGVTNGVRNTS